MELLVYVIPFSLIIPGYCILETLKIKTQDSFEKISLSYIVSLAMILGILYLGANFNVFIFASITCLAVFIVAIIYIIFFSIRSFLSNTTKLCEYVSSISSEKILLIISSVALLSTYSMYLISKAILDSDVVHYYLPIARQIFLRNELAYSGGYDYLILLKPIALSVFVAWTYFLNGSFYPEPFRLMPIIPILMLIILNYKISLLATNSKAVSYVSSLIFFLMPFHERFLLYSSFYPDTFYYPLIFASIYYLIRYFESKDGCCVFWIGLSLGVASLFKAQTIYFLIVFTLLCLSLDFKRTSKLLLALAPFYVILPIVLSRSIESGDFSLFIPNLTQIQWILFGYLFALTLLGISMHVMLVKNKKDENTYSKIWSSIKRLGLMYLPIMIFAALWYIPNYFKFGTLIWTSNIGLPNYAWALDILSKSSTTYPMPTVLQYIIYFITIFIDPAVMGYVMLIPFLLGLFHMLRNSDKYRNLTVLTLFAMITVIVILSHFVMSISPSQPVPGYNPRDILTLSSFMATVSAIGFIKLIGGKDNELIKSLPLYLLLSYFGLLSYAHSVMVWFIQVYDYPSLTRQFVSTLVSIVGLNLQQTSFQIPYEYRPFFISEILHKIFLFSVIVAFPIFIIVIFRWYPLFTKGFIIRVKLHMPCSMTKKRVFTVFKNVIILCLLSFIIVFPRVEIFMTLGGFSQIEENQLRNVYGAFYDVFSRKGDLDGGILTFKAPMGLAYYLPNTKIIDLAYPANLAYLHDALTAGSIDDVVERLKQQEIKYLLIDPSRITDLDCYLNYIISNITHNPKLVTVSQKIEKWVLFKLS